MVTAFPEKTEMIVSDLELAALYLSDRIHLALVKAGQSLRIGDIARRIGLTPADARLVRVILLANRERFTIDNSSQGDRVPARERYWTIWSRFLDTEHTMDRNLLRILENAGSPILSEELSVELHYVYRRPLEITRDLVHHFVAEGKRYVLIGDGYVAPASWLLDTEGSDYSSLAHSNVEREEEVLFDNFLLPELANSLKKDAEAVGLSSSRPKSISEFLDSVGAPVPNLMLQFLLYINEHEEFSTLKALFTLFMESGATLLSNGEWIGPAFVNRLAAQYPILAEQDVSDEAEMEEEAEMEPLILDEEDIEHLVREVIESDHTVFSENLLQEYFDVMPGSNSYQEDLKTISDALRQDNRILWLGANRFCLKDLLPQYVHGVPESFEIHDDNYLDIEGNPVDVLIEDSGFDGGLEKEVLAPFAQDVLDEETPAPPDPNPPTSARAVIKYHHKQIGTMPLCQFPSGFFPPEPEILEVEFLLPGGLKAQVWVNNSARLLFGLLDWFIGIPLDSGATFTLARLAEDRYSVSFNGESEPPMFISQTRINDLLLLQERVYEEQMSTFDIIREIVEHYKKGIEYLTLLTELNVVRRVSRRMAASILSEYHCFFQRGGAWVYDPKKLSQGFDRSKRKYMLR